MFEMIRTFNSIGQGAFYTEEFTDHNFTMIYDCGSYQNKSIIESEIKKGDLNKEIDLLVISHFHEDHINGLEYLLKNHNIKNIILPFLHPSEKIEVFLHNSNQFIQNLCLNPKETIKENSEFKDTKIIFVSEYNKELENSNPVDISNLNDSVNSGTEITIATQAKHCKWTYVPFNFRFKERSSKLISIFKKEKIPLTIEEFLKYYAANKDKVIKAYRSLIGDMNTNSLVLYSGVPKQNKYDCDIECYSRSHYAFEHYRHYHQVGCLYLGDYNSKGVQKWKQLEGAFKEYFEFISVIQIPHHGSRHNYNSKLNFRNNLISIMSAGINNKFKHPHASTVKKIVLNNGIPIIVTENPSTRFIQKVRCYF